MQLTIEAKEAAATAALDAIESLNAALAALPGHNARPRLGAPDSAALPAAVSEARLALIEALDAAKNAAIRLGDM